VGIAGGGTYEPSAGIRVGVYELSRDIRFTYEPPAGIRVGVYELSLDIGDDVTYEWTSTVEL